MNRSSLTAVFTMFVVVSSFQTTPVTNQLRDTVATGWPQFCMPPRDEKSGVWETKINSLFAKPAFNSVLVVAAAFLLSTSPVNADEYGRETEAPTLFTGETEMVSKHF